MKFTDENVSIVISAFGLAFGLATCSVPDFLTGLFAGMACGITIVMQVEGVDEEEEQ